jgi:hypothetical protein
LGNRKREGIGRLNTIEINARQVLAVGNKVRGMQPQAGRNKIVRTSGSIEKLKTPAPQGDGFRLISPGGRLVDNADRNLITGQLGSHGQTHRASSHDQHRGS